MLQRIILDGVFSESYFNRRGGVYSYDFYSAVVGSYN